MNEKDGLKLGEGWKSGMLSFDLAISELKTLGRRDLFACAHPHTFWGEGTTCSFQIRAALLQHKLALGLISQTPDALSGGGIER